MFYSIGCNLQNMLWGFSSVLMSCPKTGKRMRLDQTKTGNDWTSSPVFWFLRIKDQKKTGLYGLVFAVKTSLNR